MVIHIEVDADLCVGHGRCYASAPDVYQADEVGYNEARGRTIEVASELEKSAQFGIDSCPEGAIQWSASA